jgi:hypothetical protein
MQQTSLSEFDFIFFELIKSIQEIKGCVETLSPDEIEKLQVSANVLNTILSKSANKSVQLTF